jgi:hypothetical protein
MLRTFNPARGVAKIGLKRPDRQILEKTLGLPIVHASPLAALGADRPAVAARLDVNDQGFNAVNEHDANGAVNKRLEPFDLIQ